MSVERTNVSKQLGYLAPMYQELEAKIRRLTTAELRKQSIECLTDPRLIAWMTNMFHLAVMNDELACRALEAEATA